MALGLNESDIKRVIWTALQAFIGAVIVLAPGIFQAPNLEAAKTLAIAALVAGVAAALSALKNLVLGDDSTLK
jgi:drug/metabolite transporter (DMT)-like permease